MRRLSQMMIEPCWGEVGGWVDGWVVEKMEEEQAV